MNLTSENIQFYGEDNSLILQVTTMKYDEFYYRTAKCRDPENTLEASNFVLGSGKASLKKLRRS